MDSLGTLLSCHDQHLAFNRGVVAAAGTRVDQDGAFRFLKDVIENERADAFACWCSLRQKMKKKDPW